MKKEQLEQYCALEREFEERISEIKDYGDFTNQYVPRGKFDTFRIFDDTEEVVFTYVGFGDDTHIDIPWGWFTGQKKKVREEYKAKQRRLKEAEEKAKLVSEKLKEESEKKELARLKAKYEGN